MNPESDATAGNDAPREAPTAVNPVAPPQAAHDAAPAVPCDAASAGAVDSLFGPAHELASGASPAGNITNAPELSPAGNITNAPELSPAGNITNAPELSPAACGARLVELFPALFVASAAPGPIKPIKLRIHADIQARAPGVFTKRMLGLFFSRHTTTNAYLKALTLAAHRFDLDGQPAGEISDEHRRLAAEELARRHALAAQRRAAQRPAPRRDVPTAEGEALSGAGPEERLDRRPGPRPDTRPDRRPGARPDAQSHTRPPARPAQPPRDRDRQLSEHVTGAQPIPRPARPPRHSERPMRADRAEMPSPERAAAAPAALPPDAEQRERALLLRSFESSPLSKANFCALKGMTEAALDAALARAQAERGGPSKAAPGKSGSAR